MTMSDPLRFEALLVEWAAITSAAGDHVGVWTSVMTDLAREEHRLRSQGKWLRGRDDLFGVLGIGRAEVRHSSMVAWLFDPSGRHGLGDRFLRGVLAAAFPGESFERLPQARPECEVAREECRADIVVWAPDVTLVVETKVDDVERPRQCDVLFARFGDEPAARFIFLTPDGRRPLTASGAAGQAFAAVSFSELRLTLDRALRETSARESARHVAEDYLRTLRKEFR